MKKIALYIALLIGINVNFALIGNADQERFDKSAQMAEEFEDYIPAFSEVLVNFGARSITIVKNVAITEANTYCINWLTANAFISRNNLKHAVLAQFLIYYPFSSSIKEALVDGAWAVKDTILTMVIPIVNKELRKPILGLLFASEIYGAVRYTFQRLALVMLNRNPELTKQRVEERSKNQYREDNSENIY